MTNLFVMEAITLLTYSSSDTHEAPFDLGGDHHHHHHSLWGDTTSFIVLSVGFLQAPDVVQRHDFWDKFFFLKTTHAMTHHA